MSRTIKFILLMGLILSMALSACGSPAPTEAPATEAVVATEAPAAKATLAERAERVAIVRVVRMNSSNPHVVG